MASEKGLDGSGEGSSSIPTWRSVNSKSPMKIAPLVTNKIDVSGRMTTTSTH
jgi:hypothetical protein